jgi:hypothetical protein
MVVEQIPKAQKKLVGCHADLQTDWQTLFGAENSQNTQIQHEKTANDS